MLNKIKIILVIAAIICLIPIKGFCDTALDDAISDGDKFISNATKSKTFIKKSEVKKLSNSIYKMILAIGMVVAVAIGSVLGIKFMISSVEEKAKIKEMLMVYVIGCIVLFGAFTIWSIVIGIFNNK